MKIEASGSDLIVLSENHSHRETLRSVGGLALGNTNGEISLEPQGTTEALTGAYLDGLLERRQSADLIGGNEKGVPTYYVRTPNPRSGTTTIYLTTIGQSQKTMGQFEQNARGNNPIYTGKSSRRY